MAVWSLYTELLEDALFQDVVPLHPDRPVLVAAVVACRKRPAGGPPAEADLLSRLEDELAYDIALIRLCRAYGFRPDPKTFANPDRYGRTNPAGGRRQLEEFVLDRVPVAA